MIKLNQFLKALFIITVTAVFCAKSHAQTVLPGEKKIINAAPEENEVRADQKTLQVTPVTNIEKKQDEVIKVNQSNGVRNCTTKMREPFTISRKDFNNLPESRKQFILDNSSKYTIID